MKEKRMKNWKKLLMIVLAMVMLPAGMPTYRIEVQAGISEASGDYDYEIKEDGVEITKYNGNGGDVVIPSKIDGKKVIGIGYRAFLDCSSLTSVMIPDSVSSIGISAFYGCSSLTSVSIPDSVTSIKDSAFYGCSSLTSVSIPDSVTSIGDHAFQSCSSLTSVSIPDSVSSIGDHAFFECTSLTSVSIPDSVTSIKDSAFQNCSSLTSVSIPDSVTSIKDSAFENCSSLTSVSIPDSVTSIGYSAFQNCSSLTSITIPDSVTSIEIHAFQNCSSLTSVSIPDSVSSIESFAFSYCSSLTSVSIPDSVTSIGYYAFYGCSSLTSVSIPDSVSFIGEQAFSYCTSLTSVSIPDSVSFIGEQAFSYCTSLTSVSIPASVSSIGSHAFGFYYVNGYQPVPGFIIYGDHGSEAERYAAENGFGFNKPLNNDISKATITLEKSNYVYDGKPKTPSVTVKLDGKTLTVNTDYTVSYSNNTNAGTAKATVTGMGRYTGSKSVTFTITKASGQADSRITCKKNLYQVAYGAKPFKINASSKSKLTFTSSKPKIAAVNKNTGTVTVKNTGIAVITIKAGKDAVKVTVKVSPKKASIKSATAGKGRKLTVKWAKDKTASGYQVQASTDKNFKKDVKTKKVPVASYTFTKLKTGKKYYVRLRSYKESGKETLCGTWSRSMLSGKIKK